LAIHGIAPPRAAAPFFHNLPRRAAPELPGDALRNNCPGPGHVQRDTASDGMARAWAQPKWICNRLETLERVAERIDKISVFGGLDQVLNGLVKLR